MEWCYTVYAKVQTAPCVANDPHALQGSYGGEKRDDFLDTVFYCASLLLQSMAWSNVWLWAACIIYAQQWLDQFLWLFDFWYRVVKSLCPPTLATGGNVHQRCDRIPLRQYNVVLPSQRGRAPCDAFLALCGPGLVCGTFSPGRKRHAINNGPEPPGPPATCFYCTSYR